jgi:hypothetical protein
MITIVEKRIQGLGKGTEMGFPTINFFVEELHPDMKPGLWAGITHLGQSISLVSKYKKGYRIETHITTLTRWHNKISVNPGEKFAVSILGLLRGPKKIKDAQEQIKKDIQLCSDYFKTAKTCYSCHLFYSQDYGYSNYTVEGTNYGCYANVFEETDGSDDYVKYSAIGCNQFAEGEYWELDCDGENQAPTEDLIKSMIRDAKINNILK